MAKQDETRESIDISTINIFSFQELLTSTTLEGSQAYVHGL